ncbi:hypothetical protein AYK25_02340 [Thermoplasmatales archaeon SM1-50]|nr:MAG: hypothetical protein AYK25_02340 [Thermoplasmatales archaeon SM1-50]
MKNKMVVFFVCMLMIITALPVIGTINEKTKTEVSSIDNCPVIDIFIAKFIGIGNIPLILGNYGEGTAIDIEWEMKILSGPLFSPKNASGSIDELEGGDYEIIRVPSLGLGFAAFEFYCNYSIQNITGSFIVVKQEYRDFALGFLHMFFIFIQPEKEWHVIDTDDVHYFNETDQDGCHIFVEGINNMHNVRVMEGADDRSEDALFLAATKFTNGNATLYEYGLTRDIVEGGDAHWEIELVNDE